MILLVGQRRGFNNLDFFFFHIFTALFFILLTLIHCFVGEVLRTGEINLKERV